jgi:D-amino-acid oxidase
MSPNNILSSVHLSQVTDELVLQLGEKSSTQPSRRILVVGGGVTGLTVSITQILQNLFVLISFQTAWALLDAGYAVTVVSEKWANSVDRITSQIAGAL